MEAESGGGRASLDLEAANSQLWVCSPLMRRRATSVATERHRTRRSRDPGGGDRQQGRPVQRREPLLLRPTLGYGYARPCSFKDARQLYGGASLAAN